MTEERINQYTEDENKVIDYLHSLVENTLDPECPIEIYKTGDDKKTIKPILSFTLDQELAHPKWFNLSFLKTMWRVEVVLSKDELEGNPELSNLLDGYKYQYPKNNNLLLQIDCEPNYVSLMELLKQISPVLINRFKFLYEHRIIDPVGCHLINDCNASGKCKQDNREMYIRCAFRKQLDKRQ